MKKAIYPGTFDPLTFGHLDIIERAAEFVEELHILIADNHAKKPMFTVEERTEMLRLVTKHLDNVVIAHTDKLVVQYAKEKGIRVMIRGLRNTLDYESEYALYSFNRNLEPKIDTFLMFPTIDTHYVSSSGIKELVSHGADISPYVPKEIIPIIVEKYNKTK